MKKIIVKRLIFTDGMGTEYIGSQEYDGRLTDANILGSLHTIGKTVWKGNQLWQINPPMRLEVGKFYQYEKSIWNLIYDRVRRII